MLNYKLFQEKFELIELNFAFKYPSKLLVLVYEKLKDLSEEEFIKGFDRVMQITSEEWNKKYGFSGRPSLSSWLEFFKGKKQSPEDQAMIEVARILDYANYYTGRDVIFDNEFTNATVKRYGGISKIAWDIADDNNNKRPLEWVRKELVEMWLSCFKNNQGSFEKCTGRIAQEVFSNGKFIKIENKLDFVGDKKKCLMLNDKINSKGSNLNAQSENKVLYPDTHVSLEKVQETLKNLFKK